MMLKNLKLIIDMITSQVSIRKEGGVNVVVKCYESSASFKWFILSPMFRASYPYVFSSAERMRRELDFFLLGDWESFAVPRIIDFDLKRKCVKREFVDARPPERPEDFELIGVALNEVHDKGYVMGDTKPQNYVIKGDTVYVIDAEQSMKQDNKRYKAWDLVVLFFFTSYLFLNSYEKFVEAVEYFKKGYSIMDELAYHVFDYRNLGMLGMIPAPFLVYLKRSLLNS